MTAIRPLTHAPLPSWRDLLSAFSGIASDDELAAPWVRPGESVFWFSRSAWSMAMLARWRQQILEKKYVSVWLPDYFCNAALAPLREMGAKLVFYPMTEQLEPDLAACHALACKQPIDLFVLVHYFGQPAPAELIALFCEKHRAWLIEDAAHVLQPIAGVGESGDCVLYSPHKHLPIPDGAVMVVRPNGPAKFAEAEISMKVLSEVRSKVPFMRGKSNRSSVLWLLKRIGQRLGLRARSGLMAFQSKVAPSPAALGHPSMSPLAKRLLKPLRSELQRVAAHRKQNAQIWSDVLGLASANDAVTHHQVAETPYLAAFSASSAVRAEALFNLLQKTGIPVTTWPDLPPEVLTNEEAHSGAIKLRFSRFYLPVHQSLYEHQQLACGAALAARATSRWQTKALARKEWDEYWQTCPQTNLLQSWQYGAAKQEAEGWMPHRLLIIDETNQPIALVQVLTKGLPLLGHVARINRGPLLLHKTPEVGRSLLAIRALLDYAKKVHWRMVQIAPELAESSQVVTGLCALGLRRVVGDAWGSGRLALNIDEQSLLMGLKGKWRNCMRKGEKLGVIATQQECNDEQLALLIRSYMELQDQRNFDGISEKIISALSNKVGELWQFNLFIARVPSITTAALNEPLGVLVTVRAGDTATYFIGSATDEGRRMQANSVLLWQAILQAKKTGCSWFDIGGLSEVTPKGIAEFKQGLNAEPYNLVGEWRQSKLSILSSGKR